jgi:hypothetical protein
MTFYSFKFRSGEGEDIHQELKQFFGLFLLKAILTLNIALYFTILLLMIILVLIMLRLFGTWGTQIKIYANT